MSYEIPTGRYESLPCGGGVSLPNNTYSPEDKRFGISYNNVSIEEYGCATTAIEIYATAQFLILNGNHVAAYQGLTLEQAIGYFYQNIDKANFRSEHGKLFGYDEERGRFAYIPGGY